MISKSKGFTIIELLVVIAIIAILATILIVNLGAARNKANDAKTKAQTAGLRSAAAIYNDTNGHYGAGAAAANCVTGGMGLDTASGFSSLIAVANYPSGTTIVCNTNATAVVNASAWAASASLSTSSTSPFWCVDSTGAAKGEAAALGAGIVACP